jgi:hypothetical protein
MEAGNRLWKRATVYGSGQPFMEAGNRLWKRATVYRHSMLLVRHSMLPSLTNNLTLKRIANIILTKVTRPDLSC